MQKFFLFFFALIIFVSCAQTSPSVNFSTSSVIFDYENYEDMPSSRLAIFIDLSSDEHRAEGIKIESRSTGYIWEASSPLKFENDDRKYTGYTNFVMPNSELFPQGQYKLIYTDASDETVETVFNLSYSADVAEMNANEAASHIEFTGGNEYWAVYDEYEILVFLGQRKGDMFEVDDVWSSVENASYVRSVWMTGGSRTVCIMPKIYKDDKSSEDIKNIESNIE